MIHTHISISLLTVHLQIPVCNSLKDKRSVLKPLLNRLHQQYNISAAEIDHQDSWHESILACVVVSNDATHNHHVLEQALQALEKQTANMVILEHHIENI